MRPGHRNSNAEVDHARRILARGTSADRQLALYQQQLDRGLAPSEILKAIVDHLVVETVANVKALGPTALALPVHKATHVIQGLPKLAY